MCARPERTEYYPPIAELAEELRQYSASSYTTSIIADTAWVGTTAFRALLENA